MPVITPHKMQGYKAQVSIVPPGGGAAIPVLGLKQVDWEIKADKLDTTDHSNNGWKSSMYGLLEWSGTAKLDRIIGDTSQEDILNALLTSANVSMTLYPEQTAVGSGEDSYVGTAIITSFKNSAANTGIQGVDIAFEGVGALVTTAQ